MLGAANATANASGTPRRMTPWRSPRCRPVRGSTAASSARGSERFFAQWRHLHPCRTPDDDPAAQGRLERLQAACDRRPIHLQFLCSCIEATLSDNEEEGDQPFHLGDGFPALHRLMMHERTSSVQFPLSQMH